MNGLGPPVGRGGPQTIPRPPEARPGSPAPWRDLVDQGARLDMDSVRRAVDGRDPGVTVTGAPPRPRESAILIPLYEDGGEMHVILTTRSTAMRSHSGEVSFPGGRLDPGETLAGAALREAYEEVDLDPSSVTIVGELDRLATWSSGASIHPFVGFLESRPTLTPNPSEVARILHVRVSELFEPGVYREEIWAGMGFGGERPLWFFELEGDTVWGATASVLRQLLMLSFDL